MICAKCHKNEATIHFITVVDGQQEETVHLCKQCAPLRTHPGPVRYEARPHEAIEQKFSKEVQRKILKYVIENRQLHSLRDISEHVRLSESDTKSYMDVLEK